MATYIKKDKNNKIIAVADWEFPGSIKIDNSVKLNKFGEYEIISKKDKSIEIIQEEINLKEEYTFLINWLKEHDYIGIKIATGRATIDEYKDQINTMNKYSCRINEINKRLIEINNTYKG